MLKTTFKDYLRLAKLIGKEITSNSLGIIRSKMPQIKDLNSFEKFLKENNIKFEYLDNQDPMLFKSAQKHVNAEKIVSLLKNQSEKEIIISEDDYVIDGTHRWASAVMKLRPIKILKVSMKASELIEFIKENYEKVSFQNLY